MKLQKIVPSSCVLFNQLPATITSCVTIEHYQNQEIDIDDTRFGPIRKTLQFAQCENPCFRQSTDEVSPLSGKVKSGKDVLRTRL